MIEVAFFLVLSLALALNEHARASQPVNVTRVRSRVPRSHARRATRSSYMAHPQEIVR